MTLPLLTRFEGAVVWELFDDERWRGRWAVGAPPESLPNPWHRHERAPRPSDQTKYEYLGTLRGEACLTLRGGGQVNFTGLRRSFGATLPTRVAFRYRIARTCRRRAYFNVFLSKQSFRSASMFYAGSPDVFSFLLPLGGPHRRAELWLPANSMDAIRSLCGDDNLDAADGEWHSIDARFAWCGGNEELVFRVDSDGKPVVEPSRTVLHPGNDAFRHVYLFNWISDPDGTWISGSAGGDDNTPEAHLADLVIEHDTSDEQLDGFIRERNLNPDETDEDDFYDDAIDDYYDDDDDVDDDVDDDHATALSDAEEHIADDDDAPAPPSASGFSPAEGVEGEHEVETAEDAEDDEQEEHDIDHDEYDDHDDYDDNDDYDDYDDYGDD
eukprot:CAMPEP_0198673630 /NCGR_PEP_ID=MMETSP1467-20131203/97433_1 /TAXON_ID=1462469 /ORGANISM="unid. sp., Strain CCMP2135" /LENGTH=382 /DNA_ID=CAMNT_0044410509 /DNA_START=52 /DNA_END=1200 /DNA_ORIENTATION=-